jgi:hypothetical protein
MYKEIEECLPLFEKYSELENSKSSSYLQKVGENIYLAILRFHELAYKHLKKSSKGPIVLFTLH